MQKNTTLPTIFVIFGVTGDLARKKLIPALFALYKDGRLPPLMQMVGFARREMSDEDFQRFVQEILLEDGADESSVRSFIRLLAYCRGDFTDRASYDGLARLLGKHDEAWNTCANKLFHLAVPPVYYDAIIHNLADSGLTDPCSPEEGWTRVIVEKPFGSDSASAQALDEQLGKLFREEQVYRIDHYLGKDTVQNILAFRFSNVFLEPAWNARSVERIAIRLYEASDVRGRGSFYDSIGALRDVGQNHMLQLLALFTMKNPGSFDADSIRKARAEALNSLEAMDIQDIARHTLRGQYAGYEREQGVLPQSATETFFRIEARLATHEWRGVPIVLEGGKALGESRVEVVVQFRHHTPCLCPPSKHLTNVLKYEVQPQEGITISFWAKGPGAKMEIEEKAFSFDYDQAFTGSESLDAYAKLILDVIEGNQTSFVSTDEIIASWKFIDPIVSAWQQGQVPLVRYKKGASPDAIVREHMAIPPKRISYIGLGKMGANMAQRLVDYGWDVTAYDPDEGARKKVEQHGVTVVDAVAAVVDRMNAAKGTPRIVWLMVPHGVVDDVLNELVPHLHQGDIVIDGGNSFYKDSIRRGRELTAQGIRFLDVGVSGGPSGARDGACLMIGGDRNVYKSLMGLFSDLSVAGGYDYMGELGAGHFVKMVHNGIEYGMMQAIAEGFAVLKEWRGELDLERIAHLYGNGSVIESRLVHWLKDAYVQYGTELTDISGTVAQSGEGAWTVDAAKELGIPVPVIEQSLQFRIDSEKTPSYTGKIVSALRNQFGGHNVTK